MPLQLILNLDVSDLDLGGHAHFLIQWHCFRVKELLGAYVVFHKHILFLTKFIEVLFYKYASVSFKRFPVRFVIDALLSM